MRARQTRLSECIGSDGGLTASLQKSDASFPDVVNFHRALSGLKLAHASIGILPGTAESRQPGTSLGDLKRSPVNLFGTQFLEAHEEIVKAEMSKNSDDNDDAEEERLETDNVADSFGGTDGTLYELRKARPKKTTVAETWKMPKRMHARHGIGITAAKKTTRTKLGRWMIRHLGGA